MPKKDIGIDSNDPNVYFIEHIKIKNKKKLKIKNINIVDSNEKPQYLFYKKYSQMIKL
jgi:hypothetical protein